LAEQLNLEFIDLYGVDINFDFMGRYPMKVLKEAEVIPFLEDEDSIHMAFVNPLSKESIDFLNNQMTLKTIKQYIALKDDVWHSY